MKSDLTVNEFCSSVGISRPTVYRMIKNNELFAYKVRGSTRIPSSELERVRGNKLDTTQSKRERLFASRDVALYKAENSSAPAAPIDYEGVIYLDCADYLLTNLVKELTDMIEVYGENALCRYSYDNDTKDNILQVYQG